MKDNQLPSNVYQLPQGRFKAISGDPWVYWISSETRNLFLELPVFEDVFVPVHGTATYDNSRFLRFWWEAGIECIAFSRNNWNEFEVSGKNYVPYMKGGAVRGWYGNQEYVLQLINKGKAFLAFLKYKHDSIRGLEYIFHEGITWSDLSSKGFAVRYLPAGFIFDVKGSSGFTTQDNVLTLIGLMNSTWMNFALGLLNPTVSFQVGDISRVPVKLPEAELKVLLESNVVQAIQIRMREAKAEEKTYEFILPFSWQTGQENLAFLEDKLAFVENHLNNIVYEMYGISERDREAIETELNWGNTSESQDDEIQEAVEEEETISSMTRNELAVFWISYAVGIILSRFYPGTPDSLGSAIFRREDFAKGSLPIPDAAEFAQLVGPKEHAAYIDAAGGWHMLSQTVEQALCALALPDGIGVLSENHLSDLTPRVRKALDLLLGEAGAGEVIAAGAGGDLRKFLDKEYFTNYHLKWYRKRPVYWYIQSSKRNYGFVIFHEKITKDTFYAIQREPYLDTKRNAVNLEMQDMQARILQAAGGERKKLEKRLAELRELAEELAQFAKDLEAITLGGYEPAPDWIDDGLILRMAPLWKVIPLWKSEPKKYWERLEAGEFDWSHIAMRYWPERVGAKCKTNKSYAIAHGHEEK